MHARCVIESICKSPKLNQPKNDDLRLVVSKKHQRTKIVKFEGSGGQHFFAAGVCRNSMRGLGKFCFVQLHSEFHVALSGCVCRSII